MAGNLWKRYFDFSSIDKNRTNGLCKLCNGNYKDRSGGFSNFLKHLKRKHLHEYRKLSIDQRDDLSDETNVIGDEQAMDLLSTKCKQNRINLSIAKNLIIKCNLPLSIVENCAFREFMNECGFRWKPISNKKLKHDIIPLFKNKIHKTIDETLRKVHDITITVDGWSDRRCRSFLAITCHFIDDTMTPQAYLIDFLRMKSPHTGENIQQLTEHVLDQFHIKEKVFKIITDNASSMIKAYKFGLSVGEDNEIDIDENKQVSNVDTTFEDYDRK